MRHLALLLALLARLVLTATATMGIAIPVVQARTPWAIKAAALTARREHTRTLVHLLVCWCRRVTTTPIGATATTPTMLARSPRKQVPQAATRMWLLAPLVNTTRALAVPIFLQATTLLRQGRVCFMPVERVRILQRRHRRAPYVLRAPSPRQPLPRALLVAAELLQ